MKRVLGTLVVAIFLVWSAAAQTSASTQTNGSAAASAQAGHTQASGSAAASNNTSATAGRSGAQASSSTAASSAVGASHSPAEKTQSKREEKPEHGSSASAAGSLASGSTLNAVLSRPVDSRKNKPGDQVMATTTQDVKSDGHVVIPKHSRLVGHVTGASAKGKGDANSSLGIVFDKAVLKNGQEVPVHAVIQALAASQASLMTAQSAPEMEPMAPMAAPMTSAGGGRAGGGLVGSATGAATSTVGATAGGLGQTVGGTEGAAGNVAGSAAGRVAGTGASAMTDGSGRLLANTSGVTGLPGVTLQSVASNATQGSVVTSSGKNVHLDGGTQMVLRVVSQ